MLFTCFLALANFHMAKSTDWVWTHRTYDIYMDGKLNTEARLYHNKEFGGFALDLPGSDKLVLLQETDDKTVVYHASRRAFVFSSETLKITCPADLTYKETGAAHEVEDHQLLFSTLGHSLLLSRHLGVMGPQDETGLYAIQPAWEVLGKAYEPDAEALASLKAVEEPTQIEVFYGTWCGDSKKHVPRLLSTLVHANNPNLQVELVAVGSGFTEPWQELRERHITNVPTIIVSRKGAELGRFVETPNGDSVEGDMADILGETYLPKTGDYRAGKLISTGTLTVRDESGRLQGNETWKLFSRNRGGFLIWSRVEDDEGRTEVVLSSNEQGRPTFLELTRDNPSQIRRTRYQIGKTAIKATLRGSDTGIVKQELGYSGNLLLETPSRLINGWVANKASNENGVRLVLHDLMAHLETLEPPTTGRELIDTASGRLTAQRKQYGQTTFWFHKAHGLPMRIQEGQLTALVTSLKL